MKAGSQCQRQRPSWPSRRFFRKPSRSLGRRRCGKYLAMTSAASLSDEKPSLLCSPIKPTIFVTPLSSKLGVISTRVTEEKTPGFKVPAAMTAPSPPSDAPTMCGAQRSHSNSAATAIRSLPKALRNSRHPKPNRYRHVRGGLERQNDSLAHRATWLHLSKHVESGHPRERRLRPALLLDHTPSKLMSDRFLRFFDQKHHSFSCRTLTYIL